MDDDNGSWDADRSFERSCEQEPAFRTHSRRAPKLDPRGSVRISYVCPEEVHNEMKRDGRFDALPAAPRAEFIVVDFEDGSPLELHRYANCSCNSTLVKVVATSDALGWLDAIRKAGL